MSRFRNQHRLIDQDKLENLKFVVIGAGAIGSYFVTTLSKMGARDITVYDDDTIEDHNISNQIYPLNSIGQKKVETLGRMSLSFGDCVVSKKAEKWDSSKAITGDIIVSAVDNMDTRKDIWDHYKAMGSMKFFIDGRMSAQVYRVYGIDMANKSAINFYETTLYPQSEASEEPCGQKSIIYTVLNVASQMLSQVKHWIMDEYRPTELIYDCFNDEIVKRYHMERLRKVIEAPEEELVNA